MISAMENTVPAVDESIAAVEEQFTILFNQVSAGMRDRAARVHPELQPVGYKLLSTLVRTGPTHAGALAGMLSTDKSVVSRQVHMLEQLGLVERRIDPEDRRASFLVATPAAVERVNEVRVADQVRLYRSLRRWAPEDVERFAELIARLNRDGLED